MDKKILEYTSTGFRSPGPAAYNVKPTIGREATDPSMKRNPAYSLQGRRMKELQPFGPGPAYDTARLNRHGKERTPGGLFGMRFPVRKQEVTPGPADYCVRPAVNKVVGGLVMRSGTNQRAVPVPEWPGPNAYSLPGTCDKRGVRIGGKRHQPAVAYETPGPYLLPHGDLYLPGNNRNGRSLGKRFLDREPPSIPGPADYDGLVRATCHATRCRQSTFGSRRPDAVGTFAVPEDNQDDCYR